MKRNTALLLASTAAVLITSQAFAQSVQLPTNWNASTLPQATYVVLPARIEGNANLVSADQQTAILAALKRDSAGAIQRRYPNAHFSEDPSAAGAVKVTPVLTAPSALVPWAKLNTRFDIQFPEGSTATLVESFSVLTLWQQSWNATNYAFDQVVKQLP